MNNLWTDDDARRAVDRWGAEHGEDFALRVYTARLIGSDPTLVLHGGGNVSVKGKRQDILGDEVNAIQVKASGTDLAEITPAGFSALDLDYLRRLRQLAALEDEDMVNELRTHLFEASAPTPSIEALLHVFLPHRFVDHSHADAVLALTNQPDGQRFIHDALGDRVAVLPYVAPGFELAREVADLHEADQSVDGVVLLHHGLVTFGDEARTSYDRHIALVDACERFVERSRRRELSVSFAADTEPEHLAASVAPVLRGLLAERTGDEDRPYRRSVLEWRCDRTLLDIVNSAEARDLTQAGPLTTDHLIRTKPWPLLLPEPDWSDPGGLRSQIEAAVAEYRTRYRAYVAEFGGDPDSVDASPRVVVLPGAGVFCWGATKREACIAADIAEHTLTTQEKAHAVGVYTGLDPEHLYTMEHRTLQRAKVGTVVDHPLAGQVVVISGGAGAIGSAVAEVCAEAGAHVVLADLDAAALEAVASRVRQRTDRSAAAHLVMDVTDEDSVRRGLEEICRLYGGVDVLVPNAGIAHVAPIDELEVADFRRVMEVNATGYLLFMREGVRVLKQQGLGGNIIISSSKNVFGPGKDFGAYSASKAAGHQLGRVAAIELAPHGIRVNMINADAVFGDATVQSGLWAEVGPQRARSRGMKTEDLPEYYRGRNLLKARVYGRHVGNAVVFFASNATPTTGAALPIDGGVVEAFPR